MKRASFLKHVAWTGSGIAYTFGAGGLLQARAVASTPADAIDFVQISDSHIGFHQAANPDVSATFSAAVDAIAALPAPPAFVVHTGDVTHLSKPQQFDDAKQILSKLRVPVFVLPGEHDFLGNNGKAFYDAFPRQGSDAMWRSWDTNGGHFVALVNVFDFESMGLLGNDQLDWLRRDLDAQRTTTPIVVFTHAPLYGIFPPWGWTTKDGAQALQMLRRFDRVTVLSGHIHQVIRHTDGNIVFATANATAYPQPAPGTAPKPGPLTLPRNSLLHTIGYRTVEIERGSAVIGDTTLG